MTEDELISAYVDGQLSQPERAALEARAQTDAALHRRVAATQLLAREARQLPRATVPRNFILPRDFGQGKPAPAQAPVPEPQPQSSLFPAWVFRIGSAAAALLFVSVVAVEVARPAAFSPVSVPYAAPGAAPAAPMIDAARSMMQATVTLGALAEGATTNVQPMAATVALPTLDTAQDKAAPGSAIQSSSETDGAGRAAAPEALLLTATPGPAAADSLPEISSGPVVSQRDILTVPAAMESPSVATPEPAPAMVSPALPEPLITPLRALAAIALLAAIVLGALGWLRK